MKYVYVLILKNGYYPVAWANTEEQIGFYASLIGKNNTSIHIAKKNEVGILPEIFDIPSSTWDLISKLIKNNKLYK